MSKPQTITIELNRKDVERIKDSLLTQAAIVGDRANAARSESRDRDSLSYSRYQSNLMDLYNNKFEGDFS